MATIHDMEAEALADAGMPPLAEDGAPADQDEQPRPPLVSSQSPGSGRGDLYELFSREGKLEKLALDIDDVNLMYRQAMARRLDRWSEIDGHYLMDPDPQQAGRGPDAEMLSSELLMVHCDTVWARLSQSMRDVHRLPTVIPVVQRSASGPNSDPEQNRAELTLSLEIASAHENMMASYLEHKVGLYAKADECLQKTARLGNGVIFQQWVEEYATRRGANPTAAPEQMEGRLEWQVIDPCDMVVWPPNRQDWQELEIAGHYVYYTRSEWRRWSMRHGLSEADVLEVESRMLRSTEVDEEKLKHFGAEQNVESNRLTRIRLQHLYLDWVMEGEAVPRQMLCWYAPDARKILYIGTSPYAGTEIKHTYALIPYKCIDGSSWAVGVGDEVLSCQTADAALRNLQIESLASSAYWVLKVKGGSIAELMMDRPSPGARLVCDDTSNENGDMVPMQMGEVPQGVQEAIADQRYRASEASTLSDVLRGRGDPVQKSGTGTGATYALIEEAAKKIGMIDRFVRDGFSRAFTVSFAIMQKWGSMGLMAPFVSENDQRILELTSFLPTRSTAITRQFKIACIAPNAATSRDGRRTQMMALWAWIGQGMQPLLGLSDQLYFDDPAALLLWKRRYFEGLVWLQREAAKLHDLPGAAEQFPETPPQSSDATQLMSMLQQQNAMLQQQIQQLQIQLAGGMPAGQPMTAQGMVS